LLSAKSRARDAREPPPFSRKLKLIISSNFTASRESDDSTAPSCRFLTRRVAAATQPARHQQGALKVKENQRASSAPEMELGIKRSAARV
jgi:hypothetical protein